MHGRAPAGLDKNSGQDRCQRRRETRSRPRRDLEPSTLACFYFSYLPQGNERSPLRPRRRPAVHPPLALPLSEPQGLGCAFFYNSRARRERPGQRPARRRPRRCTPVARVSVDGFAFLTPGTKPCGFSLSHRRFLAALPGCRGGRFPTPIGDLRALRALRPARGRRHGGDLSGAHSLGRHLQNLRHQTHSF